MAPLLVRSEELELSRPPQTIIRWSNEPVQTATCSLRAAGTFAPEPVVRDDANHASEDGTYRPPLLSCVLPLEATPPQTIISKPVQTAVWAARPAGEFAPEPVVSVDAAHMSAEGLYFPPV